MVVTITLDPGPDKEAPFRMPGQAGSTLPSQAGSCLPGPESNGVYCIVYHLVWLFIPYYMVLLCLQYLGDLGFVKVSGVSEAPVDSDVYTVSWGFEVFEVSEVSEAAEMPEASELSEVSDASEVYEVYEAC